eukprot:gene6116-6734_t
MANPDVDGVLDMTFLDIRDESEFQSLFSQKVEAYHRPPSPSSRGRTASSLKHGDTLGGTRHNTSSPGNTGNGDSPGGERTRPRSPTRMKGPIKAIRLGNNYLSSVEIIHSIPAHLDSSQILWLDLSFNYISSISEAFSSYFPEVTTIYLHANKITKLSEIKKLSKFEKLRSLSLYGNPVEENKHYRNYVLYYCRHLVQFDKSPVTKSQLNKASLSSCVVVLMEVWAQTFRKKLNPSEEDDL